MTKDRKRTLRSAVVAAALAGWLLAGMPPRTGSAQRLGMVPNDTLVVDYGSDISHLDSALCYDTSCYAWQAVMFDQLITYDAARGSSTNLIPDAASAMPVLSNGGKTYTFTLRHTIHFWNGKLATSADWVYSFERIINPKTQCPAAAFWQDIVGAKNFAAGKTAHVAGIQAMGSFGLRITLDAPNASFINVLAMPFGSVVDKASVEKAGKAYDSQGVMGTGPYILKEHVLGVRVVWEKNPHYFLPGVGRLKTLIYQAGVSTELSYLRVLRGDSDLDGDFPTPIPSAEFLNVLSDPVLGKRVLRQEQIATEYVTMNTQMKPFDNVLVRRAVNYAINKPHLLRLINGRGSVTDTWLPPPMPGYQKFNLYPYNPAMARKLLIRAGFPSGFSTTLYADNQADDPRIAQALVQQLAQVGIKADLRVLDTNTFLALAMARNKAPMTWTAYYQDFPDPNDFFEPAMTCASAIPGTLNFSFYCNPKLDGLIYRLKAMTDRSARLVAYGGLDRMLMNDAPIAPVFNSVFYSLPSAALRDYHLSGIGTLLPAYYTKG